MQTRLFPFQIRVGLAGISAKTIDGANQIVTEARANGHRPIIICRIHKRP